MTSDVNVEESDTGDVGDVDPVKTEEVEEVSTVMGALTHVLCDTPQYDPYTRLSAVMNLANVLLYIFDYVMDIMVVYWLHQEEKADERVWTWLVLTLCLIFLPLVVVNLFSIVWFHEDHKVHEGGFCPAPEKRSLQQRLGLIISHLLLVGPVVRQCQVISVGLQEMKHPHRQAGGGRCEHSSAVCRSPEYVQLYMKRKYYERDLAYLTMIDSFTQDAPQLLLQSFILLSNHYSELQHWETSVTQLASVLLSLLSLSLSLVSYSQASRWADPSMPQLSLLARLSLWLWRLFSLAARMMVLCVFLTVFTWQFFLFLSLHYSLMLVWILAMRSNFCGSIDGVRRPVSEFVFNIVMAAVFIFDIVNIKEGPSRLKNTVYYILVSVENSLLMYFWWSGNFTLIGVDKIVIIGIFPILQITAFIFLYIYYKKFHPDCRNIPNYSQSAQLL